MPINRTPFEIHAGITGHSRIDFDKRPIRKVLRSLGRQVAKEARKLVSSRTVSSPGGYPGRRTGALFRSIKSKEMGGGLAIAVAPYRTSELMRKGSNAYYPGFLLFGAKRNGRGGTLTPRQNYVLAAAERFGDAAREGISAVLRDALVPR